MSRSAASAIDAIRSRVLFRTTREDSKGRRSVETGQDDSCKASVFQVRAIDQYGNTDPTPASRTWTIDTGAPSVRRPDAQVRKSTEAVFTGNGIYDATGALALKKERVPRGGKASFVLRFENDADADDAFEILGCGKRAGIVPVCKDGVAKVSGAVTGGTYQTGTLAPGGTKDLVLTVKAKRTAKPKSVLACKVQATSLGDTAEIDAVIVRVKVT